MEGLLVSGLMELKISEQIRTLLELRGWSVATLARRSDLPYSTVDNYLRSDAMPSLAHAIRLADAFGVTLDELATGRRPSLSGPGLDLPTAMIDGMRRILDAAEAGLSTQSAGDPGSSATHSANTTVVEAAEVIRGVKRERQQRKAAEKKKSAS